MISSRLMLVVTKAISGRGEASKSKTALVKAALDICDTKGWTITRSMERTLMIISPYCVEDQSPSIATFENPLVIGRLSCHYSVVRFVLLYINDRRYCMKPLPCNHYF